MNTDEHKGVHNVVEIALPPLENSISIAGLRIATGGQTVGRSGDPSFSAVDRSYDVNVNIDSASLCVCAGVPVHKPG